MNTDANAKAAAASFQFPSGHLGHLSAEQRDGLEHFKAVCAERGVYIPAREGALPSHDDATMLRFLRARKFSIEPAYDQFLAAEKWSKENRLLDLYETIDIQEYEDTRRLYPQWVGSRDKRGMPVYLFEVGNLSSKAISAYENAKVVKGASMEGRSAPAKMLRVFALYEHMCRFVTPWCSALTDRTTPDAPITQGCNIIDISGTGIRQFWDLKSHLQDSSGLATAYYPETLDKIFIIGAPSFFPTVWKWVKGWFDPVVVGKMYIVPSGQEYQILSEHIDPAAIPKRYGGAHPYNWGDMPILEQTIRDKLIWENGFTDLPTGPVRWEQGQDGGMVAVAVGTVDGKRREVAVARLPKSWRQTFYRLDGEVSQDVGLA